MASSSQATLSTTCWWGHSAGQTSDQCHFFIIYYYWPITGLFSGLEGGSDSSLSSRPLASWHSSSPASFRVKWILHTWETPSMCWHIHNRFQLLLSQGPDLSRLRERLRMEKRLLQTTIMLKLRRRLGKMKRMRGRWKMAVRIIWMSNRPAWTRANELLKVYPYIFPGRTKRAKMHH